MNEEHITEMWCEAGVVARKTSYSFTTGLNESLYQTTKNVKMIKKKCKLLNGCDGSKFAQCHYYIVIDLLISLFSINIKFILLFIVNKTRFTDILSSKCLFKYLGYKSEQLK